MQLYRLRGLIICLGALATLTGFGRAQPVEDLYLQCPAGQVAVQHRTRVPESNGCSKPAGISIGGEEDFTACCDLHDVCYESCNVDKQFCETQFASCLQNLCRTAFAHNKGCSQAAQMYAMGTTMFGGSGFATSQEEFCECVPKEEVSAHYGSLFHTFYQTHAPDKADEWRYDENGQDGQSNKVDKYLKSWKGKAGGLRSQLSRVAKLHYEIYKRYSWAILHVGPRKGRTPPGSRRKDEL